MYQLLIRYKTAKNKYAQNIVYIRVIVIKKYNTIKEYYKRPIF